jgi:hypothetical protein
MNAQYLYYLFLFCSTFTLIKFQNLECNLVIGEVFVLNLANAFLLRKMCIQLKNAKKLVYKKYWQELKFIVVIANFLNLCLLTWNHGSWPFNVQFKDNVVKKKVYSLNIEKKPEIDYKNL